MKTEEVLICKYCKQKKEYFDCNKLAVQTKQILVFLFVTNIMALLFFGVSSLMIFFMFALSYYLIKKRKVVTCLNVDCIGFQDECRKNKKLFL
ncbi:MAG: hypothetical protein OEW60_01015 [Thiovulaceae bacterium]|nr:hypothetical protein [Sulfurimonadaceae bacterium]